jgi:hypothetical protein
MSRPKGPPKPHRPSHEGCLLPNPPEMVYTTVSLILRPDVYDAAKAIIEDRGTSFSQIIGSCLEYMIEEGFYEE